MSDIVGIKVAGTVIFIVSVLIWLITITAIFETRLQDLEGNFDIKYIPFIDPILDLKITIYFLNIPFLCFRSSSHSKTTSATYHSKTNSARYTISLTWILII